MSEPTPAGATNATSVSTTLDVAKNLGPDNVTIPLAQGSFGYGEFGNLKYHSRAKGYRFANVTRSTEVLTRGRLARLKSIHLCFSFVPSFALLTFLPCFALFFCI